MLNGTSFGETSFSDVGSVGRPLITVVASTTTIAVTSKITRVTGTIAVATITPPNPYFNGPIYLYSTEASAFTTVTTGNIALATTIVRYKLLILAYDPSAAKWYPSY